jgi:hypothetical protein
MYTSLGDFTRRLSFLPLFQGGLSMARAKDGCGQPGDHGLLWYGYREDEKLVMLSRHAITKPNGIPIPNPNPNPNQSYFVTAWYENVTEKLLYARSCSIIFWKIKIELYFKSKDAVSLYEAPLAK